MSIMKIKLKLDANVWLVLLVLLTLATLYVRYQILTEKFFVDSMNIMAIERGSATESESYAAVARIFHFINFFDLNTLLGWTIYMDILFLGINFILLKDFKRSDLLCFLFMLTSLFLWYLFCAGITKDIIQTLFYITIYVFCVRKNFFSPFRRLLFGVIILLLCAFFIRSYYVLTAFFSVCVYCVFSLIKSRNSLNRHSVLSFLLAYCAGLAVFLAVVQLVFPQEYHMITTLRSSRYLYLLQNGTDSFIGDLFFGSENSLIIYLINYVINSVRLLFPVELIMIGKFYYFPFIIYIIIFSYYHLRTLGSLSKLNYEKLLALSFLTSFLGVAVMMEPDFGSWARHLSVTWPLMYCLIH